MRVRLQGILPTGYFCSSSADKSEGFDLKSQFNQLKQMLARLKNMFKRKNGNEPKENTSKLTQLAHGHVMKIKQTFRYINI